MEQEKKQEKTILEIKTEKRVYQFICEPDSPLGEAFDVLSTMRKFVIDRISEQEPSKAKPEECITTYAGEE
jgi:hypothetical protein